MEKKWEGYTLTTFPLPSAKASRAFVLDLPCENPVGVLGEEIHEKRGRPPRFKPPGVAPFYYYSC